MNVILEPIFFSTTFRGATFGEIFFVGDLVGDLVGDEVGILADVFVVPFFVVDVLDRDDTFLAGFGVETVPSSFSRSANLAEPNAG
ncbi:TPA: hypothetical protein HA278_03600 [Candidatus Woesearchaeota archaeon]|nr:hypothetical protein [Candidatus Woesearchaeota archaeon]